MRRLDAIKNKNLLVLEAPYHCALSFSRGSLLESLSGGHSLIGKISLREWYGC